MHSSSSDHTEIIANLQSNQYMESPEVWLMEALLLGTKITGLLKMIGGAEKQNGLVLQLCVQMENWEGYLGCRPCSLI